jgi:hypothetical protein
MNVFTIKSAFKIEPSLILKKLSFKKSGFTTAGKGLHNFQRTN